jgi:hypothetical protein
MTLRETFAAPNEKGVAVWVTYYVMKTYGGVDVQTHVFFTSALVGGEWSASRPQPLYPGIYLIKAGWPTELD